MCNLQVFSYEGKEVRTIQKGNEPWWVLKDVYDVLGIEKHRDAASRLDEDERESVLVDNLGLFRVKETAITYSDGHITISKTTKVTGKGQQYFVNYFLNGGSGNENV